MSGLRSLCMESLPLSLRPLCVVSFIVSGFSPFCMEHFLCQVLAFSVWSYFLCQVLVQGPLFMELHSCLFHPGFFLGFQYMPIELTRYKGFVCVMFFSIPPLFFFSKRSLKTMLKLYLPNNYVP